MPEEPAIPEEPAVPEEPAALLTLLVVYASTMRPPVIG